jgi:hypothetical protein
MYLVYFLVLRVQFIIVITEYTFARLHSSVLLYYYYMRVVGGYTINYKAY